VRLDGAVELVLDPAGAQALAGDEPDERLLALAELGHERAFEMFVERHRPALLSCCRRIAGPTGGQDALQQTLVSAWHALQRGCEVRHARAWLLAIARHAALQIVREERRHTDGPWVDSALEAMAVEHPPEEQHEQSSRARKALAAIASLPQRERDALVWTSVHGRSGRDAARALGVSEPALRQLVCRARRRARAAFGLLLPPLPVHRLATLAVRGGDACAQRAGALARSYGGPCSAEAPSALARLTAVAIAGTVAAIPVAALELRQAQGKPLAPRASGPERRATPAGAAWHRALRAGPASVARVRGAAQPLRTSADPAHRLTNAAPRPELASSVGAARTSDAGATQPPKHDSAAPPSAHAQLAPPSLASPTVQSVRQHTRSVGTLIGGSLKLSEAPAQTGSLAPVAGDLDARVTSAASAAAGGGQEAQTLLTQVAHDDAGPLGSVPSVGR
jgi:RNA polymerase sigma-70 factor, ECF subfamily